MASKDNVLEILRGPVIISISPHAVKHGILKKLMNFSFDSPNVRVYYLVATYVWLIFMPFYCRSGYGRIHNRFAYISIVRGVEPGCMQV